MTFPVLSFFPAVALPIPVAPPGSINCLENSRDNIYSPIITQGGVIVSPDSLVIDQAPAHGTASPSGPIILYIPTTGYLGIDVFTYHAVVSGIASNSATVSVVVSPVACEEIGRTTKAVASAYYRTRIQDCRLMMGEKRCLVADFNGVISSARKVSSVIWRCDFGYIAQMSRARIQPDNRSVAVDILANWIGDSIVRAEVTLDTGETYIQPFRVDVSGDPIFMPAVSGNGPTILTAP